MSVLGSQLQLQLQLQQEDMVGSYSQWWWFDWFLFPLFILDWGKQPEKRLFGLRLTNVGFRETNMGVE